MSVKRKTKVFSFKGFDNAHYRATEQYAALVSELYNRATAEIAKHAAKGNYNLDKPFSFADYPKTRAKVQEVINQLSANVEAVVEKGSRRQWLFANKKNDEFISSIMDTSKLSKARLVKYQDRNLDALKAFQGRKVDGMNLSQRVWKYTKQYQEQIEIGLDVGLGEGRSAAQLSRDLRQNLQNPNALFRRVRDKRGNLVLSKAAKAFHPGQGVYRSAYKNAMRLTRSEINMSYRESDWLRWQSLDFIVGFEVRRSNKEPKCKCKLCERLVGRYPKTFKFKGWHPQCLCHAIPIIQDADIYKKQEEADLRSALYGTPKTKVQASNTVIDFPDEFKAWASENAGAQSGWRSTPYFVRDNFKGGLLSEGLKYIPTEKPLTLPERAKIRHQQRTPEQVKEIQDRWDERKRNIENKEFRHWGQQEFEQESDLVDVSSDEARQIQGRGHDAGYIQTSNSFSINTSLRERSRLKEDDVKTIKALDAVISRNQLSRDVLLYRMEDIGFCKFLGFEERNGDLFEFFKSKVGEVLYDQAYRSTSAIEGYNVFGHRPVMLKIRAKKGAHVYVTKNKMESEVILPRGSELRILSVEKVESLWMSRIVIESELL